MTPLELAQRAEDKLEFALWADANEFIRIQGRQCFHCEVPLELQLREAEPDGVCLRCTNVLCRQVFSIKTGSFFENSHLAIYKVLGIMFAFENHYSASHAASMVGVNRHTVGKIYKALRAMIVDDLAGRPLEFPDVDIYECDETYYQHLQTDDGHVVEKQWVAGFMHRASGRMKIYTVDNRSAEQLVPPIVDGIPHNSVVCTDTWASYNGLGNHFRHYSVNHSAGEYARQEDIEGFGGVQVHINSLENRWKQLKSFVANKQRRTYACLKEYMDVLMFFSDHRSCFEMIKF